MKNKSIKFHNLINKLKVIIENLHFSYICKTQQTSLYFIMFVNIFIYFLLFSFYLYIIYIKANFLHFYLSFIQLSI